MEREAEARRALTTAALDAASSVTELRTFLEERALPQTLQLKEHSQTIRAMLERIVSLETPNDAAEARNSDDEGGAQSSVQEVAVVSDEQRADQLC